MTAQQSNNLVQRSDAWFAARKGKVTASNVGAILGNNPYKTRADVMREMVREAHGAEREFTGNVATEYGTANEVNALNDYRLETLHDVDLVGFIALDDWAGVSPDGLIGTKGGLEIKCPYGLRDAVAPVEFKPLADQPHYYDQVQFTLAVTGREWWHFFQWCPAATSLEVVYPDLDWQSDAMPRLRQFHAEYLHEVEHNAAEHLKPKRVTIDTPEAHKMMAEWDDIAEQMERLTERKRDLLDAITDMAGGRDAEFAGRKVTQVERAGSVSYAQVVKAKLPGLDLSPWTGKPSRYWKVS